MSAPNAAEAPAEKPKKGRKGLVIGLLALLVVGGAAGGVWYYMGRQAAHVAEAPKPEPVHPPAYMPLESMTVNLADPGGERFAQLGITVELADEKAAEKIKAFLPSIRSSVLMLVSQRTSEELLTRQGKEKLARDIAVEVARPLGFAPPPLHGAERSAAPAVAASGAASAASAAVAVAEAIPEAPKKPEPKKGEAGEGGNPVRGVLFSSFIIQ